MLNCRHDHTHPCLLLLNPCTLVEQKGSDTMVAGSHPGSLGMLMFGGTMSSLIGKAIYAFQAPGDDGQMKPFAKVCFSSVKSPPEISIASKPNPPLRPALDPIALVLHGAHVSGHGHLPTRISPVAQARTTTQKNHHGGRGTTAPSTNTWRLCPFFRISGHVSAVLVAPLRRSSRPSPLRSHSFSASVGWSSLHRHQSLPNGEGNRGAVHCCAIRCHSTPPS